MTDRKYQVEVIITKKLEIVLPVDDPAVVYPGEDPEDVAKEMAMGGFEAWPKYVQVLDVDTEVDEIREIT